MLTPRRVVVVLAAAALASACSDPNAYPGGGRAQTLPGDSGSPALVQAEASISPPDAGTPAIDAALPGSD